MVTLTPAAAIFVGAGLLAKKAVEKGLTVKPWVKTALAPGSQVVLGNDCQSHELSSLYASIDDGVSVQHILLCGW